MSVIIQVWSAPSCQSGAVCFGALSPWVSAGGSEATGTPAGFRVTVTRDVADRTSLAEGRCLRVLSQSRGEQWWFVSSVSDSDGDAALVTATAGPLRQLLTVRGLVRSGSTFVFTPGTQTVTALLNTYVLTNLSDDSLSWLSLGTMEFPDTVTLGALTRVTRAGVLDAIEQATGYTTRLRALFSSGVLTGFAVDVVADPAGGLDTVLLPGVTQVQRTRDALRAATVAVPFDTAGNPMERPVWTISAITGTAPAWVALRDPVSGNPWPIREDDQVNGLYLEQRDGTQTIIADSRASDSAVQVASVGTLAVNDLVTIVRDTSGNAVIEVSSPSGLGTSRGRLVGTVSTTAPDARRNYVPNGVFATWSSDTVPADFTVASGNVGRYSRANEYAGTANVALLVDGAVPSSNTSIPVRGGISGRRLYRGELLWIGSTGYTISGTVTTFDGSGKATVPIGGTVGTTLADGDAVDWRIASTPSGIDLGPFRPTTFPLEPTAGADVCRLLTASTTLTSPATRVRSSGATAVNAAAGITIRSNSNASFLAGTNWPTLTLRDTVGATVLASTASPTAASNATAHYTLTARAVLSADTTVAARITASAGGGSAGLQWQGVRWLSLWVGDAEPAITTATGSGSNTLWHRAQDVLASAAQGTRYQLRGVDVRRLQAENVALALGQLVRLRSEVLGLDTTVKIVKLDYDFTVDEALNLELGAVVPRLSGVTVTL